MTKEETDKRLEHALELSRKYKKDADRILDTLINCLADTSEEEREKSGGKKCGDLTLREVKQMCESRDCGFCSFSLSCYRMFKGMPSNWHELDLSEEIKPDE